MTPKREAQPTAGFLKFYIDFKGGLHSEIKTSISQAHCDFFMSGPFRNARRQNFRLMTPLLCQKMPKKTPKMAKLGCLPQTFDRNNQKYFNFQTCFISLRKDCFRDFRWKNQTFLPESIIFNHF